MSQLTGEEPRLEQGEFGEWVLTLQVRLYRLRYLGEWPDTTFAQATEDAVRRLQSTCGLDNDGVVDQRTWEAIVYLEQQSQLDYYWNSPYDALAQLRYDIENPDQVQDQLGGSGEGGGAGQVSEDGQWRWDGFGWQPADRGYGEFYAGNADPGGGYASEVSEDGQWRWDGYAWRSTEHEQVSEDGQWRWDGYDWRLA